VLQCGPHRWERGGDMCMAVREATMWPCSCRVHGDVAYAAVMGAAM